MPEDDFFHALHAKLVAEAAKQEFPIDAQAIRELYVGLMEASVFGEIAESTAREWVEVIFALHSANQFLKKQGQLRELSLPLARLELYLRDLAKGQQAPMLRPHAIGGGRPVSTRSIKGRGYVAGILGGLMKHTDMTRDDAAKWVAKELRAVGRQVKPGTIIDWRQDALNHKSSPELRQAYSAFAESADWSEWSEPTDYAKWLVTRVILLPP